MLNVQFQVCNKWRKNAIVRAIFLFFPFVVRSCHKHSFLHASFFCLAVSAKSLSVSVIPLSISFRLFLISRAFLFVCPTCLSPRQRLRRGRAFFRFLPFHAAFGERDAPWLFTLYCPRPVARFFLPVASPPRAFFCQSRSYAWRYRRKACPFLSFRFPFPSVFPGSRELFLRYVQLAYLQCSGSAGAGRFFVSARFMPPCANATPLGFFYYMVAPPFPSARAGSGVCKKASPALALRPQRRLQ